MKSPDPEIRPPRASAPSRRQFFGDMGTCMGSVAFAWMLARDAAASESLVSATDPKPAHFAPRAKRVLQIFCPGAASHLDTFDYKPELIRLNGQPMPGEKIVTFQGGNGNIMQSPWGWSRRGQSGKWVSDLLPHLGGCVDDMCFVHSLTAKSNTHGPAMLQMNTGFILEGFPSMGSWLGYALGTENENLPAFVAIPDPRGLPPSGAANWSNGFLPAAHQGVAFNTDRPIANLDAPAGSSPQAERDLREFLDRINAADARRHPGESDLAARMASYALAARMQLSAPEVSDIANESAHVIRSYGADSPNPLKSGYARNCILARRLLERGVRFVQLYCGSHASGADGLLNWDAHKTLKADYERHCPILDQPTAALLMDLKQRGMLDDTLVIWTTEFGRMPTHQTSSQGRDHNPFGFTAWMAGGGARAGHSHGATDDLGYKAVQDICTIYDFHATILHLLGLNHEKLTYYHNGSRRRLTDVHGHVVNGLIA
ncbi:MAG TPA: DUF1501 domain-containing protein [Tepidisphaeraceae bacterium]|jgi:hypothetical protein|nr:DUF1501 domain-containing protein [Tepidisphaeraceae bacterium]